MCNFAQIMFILHLPWLAGGSYLDIFILTGASVSLFCCVIYCILWLIVNCKKLEIKLPQNEEVCIKVAEGFQGISCKGAIAKCTVVINSYLLHIYTPTKSDAGNVRSYFSGHTSAKELMYKQFVTTNPDFCLFQLLLLDRLMIRMQYRKIIYLTH
jgi:hypothetical protein